MGKMTPEKRAEVRRLIEEIRTDLRDLRLLLERVQTRMEPEGR
jgi:hypothetical protein